MLVAVLMWRSQIAHFTFLSAIVLSTIKNAGDFYMDVISSKYEEAASNSKVPVSKKILSASGALADVMLGK
ncbi:SPBC776.05 [Symbiodinium sp. CCMP2456]|nr:SPBC776.05 [Symbiodinium sp. CCMP2456]